MAALQAEMQADERVVVVGEDVGRGGIFGQYKGLQEQFKFRKTKGSWLQEGV